MWGFTDIIARVAKPDNQADRDPSLRFGVSDELLIRITRFHHPKIGTRPVQAE